MDKLHYMRIHQLSDMIKKKEISVNEVTRAILDRIKQIDGKVRAYMTVTEEEALRKADEMDKKIKQDQEVSPLAGIPMGLKDNMCTKGIKTTCSSKILYNFIPPYNATVYDRLEKADAVLVGKTNLDEFAMGSSTENSAFFRSCNPWDLERVPGGSSGGSAAAVAAGMAYFTLGSDTGGSIRQPGALCGVVGMKPTYGRVSRYGLVAFASSLDQIGPFTRDVTDCAMVMNHISGYDRYDSTSVNIEVPDFTKSLIDDIKGFKIAIPREYFGEGIDKEVKDTVSAAIKRLEDLGAVCEEVSLPHTDYALPVYYIIASAEASSNLARYDGVKYGYRSEKFSDLKDLFVKSRSEGFGAEVKRRIMLGTYTLSSGYYDAYYKKAQKVRTLIKQDFDKVFENYDVVVCPTSPDVAFKAGSKTQDPVQMYLSDICTIPVNIAGLPGISIPCGFVGGLPVGLQVIGKAFDEATMMRVAYAFEQNTDYHTPNPEI